MKQRNIFLGIVFSIVTVGIYAIYWFIVLTDESNRMAPKHKTASGGMAFLFVLLTEGIYYFYWCYRMGQKSGEMQRKRLHGGLYLLLCFLTLGIAPLCMGQAACNKASAAGTLGSTLYD